MSVIRASKSAAGESKLTTVTPVLTFEGHEDAVRCIFVTPNDEVVTGSNDHTARQWDLYGHCVRTFSGHNGPVTAICCNDECVFTGSEDTTAIMWPLADGGAEHEEVFIGTLDFRGHDSAISSICCMGDGGLCTGSHDGSVRIWDLETGDEVASVPHSAGVTAIVVQDYYLFTACTNGTAHMWDAATGEWLKTFQPDDQDPSSVLALCIQGNTLYSAWEDNTVRVWNIETGACTRTIPAVGPVLSSADSCVFTGTAPKGEAIKLWTAKGGAHAVFKGHTGPVSTCFATDAVLYSAGQDGLAHAYVIPPCPKTGFLEKKGGGTSLFGRRSWHKRYFVLREGKLSYFKEEPSKKHKAEPLGTILLHDCSEIKSDKDLKKELCMTLVTPQRAFMMRAGNKPEYLEWRLQLDAHLAYVRMVARNQLVDPAEEALRMQREAKQETQEVFDNLDLDGDGILSQHELEHAVAGVLEDEFQGQERDGMAHELAQEVLHELDTDGDGVISPEEFHAAAQKTPDSESESEPELAAQPLDTDGDGVISKQEFRAAAQRKREADSYAPSSSELESIEAVTGYLNKTSTAVKGELLGHRRTQGISVLNMQLRLAQAARKARAVAHWFCNSRPRAVREHAYTGDQALESELAQLRRESTSRLKLAQSLRQDMAELRTAHKNEIEQLQLQKRREYESLASESPADPSGVNNLRLELLQERAERAREQEGHRQVVHQKDALEATHRREVSNLRSQLEDLRLQLEASQAKLGQSSESLARSRQRLEQFELKMSEADDMSPKLMQAMTKATVASKRAETLSDQLDEQAAKHRTEVQALKHELSTMARSLEEALSGPMSPGRLKESYESKIASYETRIAEMQRSTELRISSTERLAEDAREALAQRESELCELGVQHQRSQQAMQSKLSALQQQQLDAEDQREDAILERDDLEKQVGKMQQSLQELRLEVSSAGSQVAESEHKARMEAQRAQALENELNTLQMQLAQSNASVDDLRAGEEAAAKIYNQAMDTMNAERDSHAIEVSELKAVLQELRQAEQHQADSITQRNREFSVLKNSLSQQLAQVQQEVESSMASKAALERHLSQLKSQSAQEQEQLVLELEEARRGSAALERMLAQAGNECGDMDAALAEVRSSLAQAQEGSRSSQRELDSMRLENQQLQQMLSEATRGRDTATEEHTRLLQESGRRSTEASTLKAELAHLQEAHRVLQMAEADLREQASKAARDAPRGKHQLAQAEHSLALINDELEHTRKMANKAGEEARRHSGEMDQMRAELSASRTKQTQMAQQLRAAEAELMRLRDGRDTGTGGVHEFRSRVDSLIKPDSKPTTVGVAPTGVSTASEFREQVHRIQGSTLDLSDHERLLKEAGSFHSDMMM